MSFALWAASASFSSRAMTWESTTMPERSAEREARKGRSAERSARGEKREVRSAQSEGPGLRQLRKSVDELLVAFVTRPFAPDCSDAGSGALGHA
jgi:hypothetical protein